MLKYQEWRDFWTQYLAANLILCLWDDKELSQGQGVSEIEVYDCGKLLDVSAVKEMHHLRKLRLYSVEAAEKTVKEAVSGLSVMLQYYD